MEIDGFTFVAQIINFVILLVLLRLTLYKPIIRVMNEREERIKARLRDAEHTQKQAEADAQALRAERRELDEHRSELMAQARRDADAHRRELEGQAREQVEAARAAWLEEIDREKQTFFQELQQRAASEVLAIARQTLTDLASAELEHHIVNRFVEQLDTMSNDEREALRQDLRAVKEPVVLRSAFEIDPGALTRVREALGDGLDMRVEQTPELICGVTLKTPRYEIAWSVDSYLKALEAQVGEAFSDTTREN